VFHRLTGIRLPLLMFLALISVFGAEP